jgi:hypothetical protein
MRSCPGRVVSGWRGKTLMIGWCCNDCGKVKYYEPAASGFQRQRVKLFEQVDQ